MFSLSTLGFGPFFENQRKSETEIVARIAAEHRGGLEVWSETGSGLAVPAGRLLRTREEDAALGVGDWVVLRSAPAPEETVTIERAMERSTVFIRGAAGRRARGQVVAANVDVVFIVCGLDGDYNLRRIERYLARVFAGGAQPVVVLNKSDICDDTEARIAEVQAVCLGVDVAAVSASREEGLARVRSFIAPGVTAAFVGSSGAGKSTLINGLLGERRMATHEVRARDGRGCHTTVHRQMIVLPEGGLVIDTPGMRELQLFDEEGIDAVFADIEALAEQCRYADCRHDSEPGCAVKAAVEGGALASDRLESFRKMQKEAEAYALRHDARKRRQSERVWGQLTREGARIRRWKESK